MTPRRNSAIRLVETDVRGLLSSRAYEDAHPSVVDHLDTAFALLSSEKVDHDVVSELGDHLRDALLDAINDFAGEPPPGTDHPVLRLRDYVAVLGLATRDAKVATAVVDLARVALRLDHRLGSTPNDDERHDLPVVWDEMRRAAFATAYACYELGQLQERFR